MKRQEEKDSVSRAANCGKVNMRAGNQCERLVNKFSYVDDTAVSSQMCLILTLAIKFYPSW